MFFEELTMTLRQGSNPADNGYRVRTWKTQGLNPDVATPTFQSNVLPIIISNYVYMMFILSISVGIHLIKIYNTMNNNTQTNKTIHKY